MSTGMDGLILIIREASRTVEYSEGLCYRDFKGGILTMGCVFACPLLTYNTLFEQEKQAWHMIMKVMQ